MNKNPNQKTSPGIFSPTQKSVFSGNSAVKTFQPKIKVNGFEEETIEMTEVKEKPQKNSKEIEKIEHEDFQSGTETHHPLEEATKENLKEERLITENQIDTEMFDLERRLERPKTSRVSYL